MAKKRKKKKYSYGEGGKLKYGPGGSLTSPETNLTFLPIDQNADGTKRAKLGNMTEYTQTVELDGKHYILPTVVNGVQYSTEQAVDMFRQTGEHMGVYNTAEEAVKAAQARERVNIGLGSTGLYKYGGQMKKKKYGKGGDKKNVTDEQALQFSREVFGSDFSQGDYPLDYYLNPVKAYMGSTTTYDDGYWNLHPSALPGFRGDYPAVEGMKRQMANRDSYGADFRKGGKLAYCDDGGDINFAYIFSDKLGTADEARKAVDKKGSRLPSDYLMTFTGGTHSDRDGGIQIDKNLRPISSGDSLKFKGKGKSKKALNTPDLSASIALVEANENTLNPKYGKGGMPYTVDTIAANTIKRELSTIKAKNEQLKNKPKRTVNAIGSPTMNDLGGRVDKLNAASSGLMTAATAAQAIPVYGQIAGAVLGAAGGITKMFGNRAAKQLQWQNDYAALESNTTDAMAGNFVPGYGMGGDYANADGGWIQKAVRGMRKDKPCTGSKFGSSTCPPGSKRYSLAKTFRKMAKKRVTGGNVPFVEDPLSPDRDEFLSYLNLPPETNQVVPPVLQFFPGPTYDPLANLKNDPRVNNPNESSSTPPYVTPTPAVGEQPLLPYQQSVWPPAKAVKRSKTEPAVNDPTFGLTKGDKLQLASMIPATLFNLGNFAAGYDREKAILNPEANRIKRLMADRNIDFQALLNEVRAERNRTEGFINRATDNQAVRRANLLSNMSNTARAASSAQLQGQMAQNQLRGEEARMLDVLGQETMQARETARGLTMANKAAWQNMGAAGFENIGEGLSRTGAAINTRDLNNMKLNIINSYPGVFETISPEELNKMSPQDLLRLVKSKQE